MAPIRIAFLNLNAGPHGEYGALLAAAVAAQEGVEVLTIIPDRLAASPRAMESLSGTRVEVVTLSGGTLSRMKGLRKAWKILKDFRPDIIHEPVGSGIATILPLRPFLPRLAPLVVTEHNPVAHPGMKGRHHRPARALTRRTATRIHVHGPKAKSEMNELGVTDDQLLLIRHGAFDEYGEAARGFSRAGSKQILIFGSLRPNKGIDMLPEIFRRVRAVHPDATLLVTGRRGAFESSAGIEMNKALDELGETPGCTVTDALVPESDIPRLFGECGVCLLPYHTATQSGVAMIAMSTGAPLVTTAVGDLPDIVEDGRTGLLSPPEPGAIADKLIDVFNDPDKARERAEAALVFTREECAWPVIGAKMADAYRDLLGRG